MASVWKHPNSKYWTACFTNHEGKQVKRSTKKTDRDDAMRISLEYEHAESMARDSVLTEAQCRKVLSDILERTTGDHIRHTSVEDYLLGWKTEKEAAKPEWTSLRYAHTIKLFLDHLKEKAKRPMTAITPKDIQSFLHNRLKAKRSTKTVSVDIKTINAAFNRARRQGIIQTNPVEAVEVPKVESDTREPFSHSQVNALLATAPSQDWKTAILLGYYTSARLSDCVNMLVESVKLAEGVIDYIQAKTGKRVIVPLHNDLEHHLKKIISTDKPSAHLCPTLANKLSGGAHGLSATFKRIIKAAGIDTKTAQGMGHRQFSKLSFHSLRHSFNSALANAGVQQELRMKLTGHTTPSINTTYTHHELDVLKKAIGKLPSLTEKHESKPPKTSQSRHQKIKPA